MIIELLRSKISFALYFAILFGVLIIHLIAVSMHCHQISQAQSAVISAREHGREIEPVTFKLIGGLNIPRPTPSKVTVALNADSECPAVLIKNSEQSCLSVWWIAEHYLVSLLAVVAILAGLIVRDNRQVVIRVAAVAAHAIAVVSVVVPLLLYYVVIVLPEYLGR